MYRPAEVHICRYTRARARNNTNAERNRKREGESERRPAAMCTRTIYLEPRRNRRRVYESRLGGLNVAQATVATAGIVCGFVESRM